MNHIVEFFTEEKYRSILNSILPGGANWHHEVGDCLETCPYFSSCKDWGPSNKLCSHDWQTTPAKPITWMVLKHIFDNFDYYDHNDLNRDNLGNNINEISSILDFPFDESLSPAEATAIVKIRLKQAEFKAGLFEVWKGCSLNDIDINNRYLVASHIIPWSKSSNDEKTNKYNGLLLPPNYDYLFDRHLMSFNNDGSILIHNKIAKLASLYTVLGVDKKITLKTVHPENIPFLSQHRETYNLIMERMLTILDR